MEKPHIASKEEPHKVETVKANELPEISAPTQADVIENLLPLHAYETVATLPLDAKWEIVSTMNTLNKTNSTGSAPNGSTNTVPSTTSVDHSTNTNTSSSLLMELAIMGTIAAQFIGEGNFTYFPENVLKHGGLWFVLAHILLVLFMALPIIFFDVLIGQITSKGVLAAYGTYCRAAKGIGISFFVITMFLERIDANLAVDNPGVNIQILVSSLNGMDDFLKCQSEWNTKNCISLYESISKCPASNNQQLAYINKNCTGITYDRVLKDVLKEYSDYHGNRYITGINNYQLAMSLFFLIVPLGLVFVDIKYTFYTFAAIFCVYFTLFLVYYMGVVATVTDDFGSAFEYIWHRTDIDYLMNPTGLNVLVNGVLYGLNIHGVMVPIGSFLLSKDRPFRIVFYPVLLSLMISIMSLVMTVVSLQSLSKYAPASGYLYSTATDGTHGILMFSQLLFSKTGSAGWLAVVAAIKLIGCLGQMSYEVIGLKEFFRDALQTWTKDCLTRLIIVASFVLIHVGIIILFCHPSTNTLVKEIYLVSAANFCKRFLYFVGLLICIKLYGEVDFRIDIAEIYAEDESWRRFFSPIGPIMFFCWMHVVPAVLLLGQASVFMESLQIFGSYYLSAIIPVIVALFAPFIAIAIIFRNKMKGNSISNALLPSEDHPSFARIVERCTISSS